MSVSNVFTNQNKGSFHTLSVRASNGVMTNILSLLSAGGGLTSAQASALIAAALTSYATTVSVNSALATYATTDASQTAAAIIAAVAPYTTTAQLTVLLATKQALLTSSTNLTCQDLSVRNLTSSASVFFLRGGVVTNLQDNLANTIVELQNSHAAFHRSVNFNDTVSFYTTIAFTNSTLGLSGQLFVGPGNKLRWQGQDVVDVPALNAAVATAMGTVSGTIGTTVNNAIAAITPPIAQLVATPSGLSLGQSGSTFAKHRIALYETIGSSHNYYGIGVHSGTNFGTGIWTSTMGNYPYSDGSTQGGVPPDIFIIVGSRFVGIGTTSPTQKLDVAGNITCVAVAQTSDRSIKENVQDASLDDLQAIFDSSEVKTYTRTDGVEGKRYGFIAQDVKSQLPSDISNIVFETRVPTPEGEEPGAMLLALDYSRLSSSVLWGVCKKQQQAIEALTLRLDALEAPKKKTTKSK
jgi:hypothetical protein